MYDGVGPGSRVFVPYTRLLDILIVGFLRRVQASSESYGPCIMCVRSLAVYIYSECC